MKEIWPVTVGAFVLFYICGTCIMYATFRRFRDALGEASFFKFFLKYYSIGFGEKEKNPMITRWLFRTVPEIGLFLCFAIIAAFWVWIIIVFTA